MNPWPTKCDGSHFCFAPKQYNAPPYKAFQKKPVYLQKIGSAGMQDGMACDVWRVVSPPPCKYVNSGGRACIDDDVSNKARGACAQNIT